LINETSELLWIIDFFQIWFLVVLLVNYFAKGQLDIKDGKLLAASNFANEVRIFMQVVGIVSIVANLATWARVDYLNFLIKLFKLLIEFKIILIFQFLHIFQWFSPLCPKRILRSSKLNKWILLLLKTIGQNIISKCFN